jgi:probable H4MPT-linked C1 transfer pathway protein
MYFPMWKNPEKLSAILKLLAKKLAKTKQIDLIALTMTAELADIYETKRDGVNSILEHTVKAFPKTNIQVLNSDGDLMSIQDAEAEPLKVAAANWAATGWLISQLKQNYIAIDVGSTSTSIIPIINGKIAAKGKTDLEKLICGELVYTGSLRTNVAAVVNSVPVQGCVSRVSSELFAQTADVHLILGNISEAEYSVDAADGKRRTRKAALVRLARVVCGDTEMLSEQEIVNMAQYVYEKQVEQITAGITQVLNGIKRKSEEKFVAVVTGLGRKFLAGKAAKQAGFSEIIDFSDLVGVEVARVSTAFAVALMGASQVEGRCLCWMQ